MSGKAPKDASTTTLLSRQLDRRAFLGGAGFTAGAVVAATLVPLSVVHALPSQMAPALTPALASTNEDASWTGHIDDACGHWPPYAHPIPYDVARTSGAATMAMAVATDAEPFDYILMV